MVTFKVHVTELSGRSHILYCIYKKSIKKSYKAYKQQNHRKRHLVQASYKLRTMLLRLYKGLCNNLSHKAFAQASHKDSHKTLAQASHKIFERASLATAPTSNP